MVLAVVAKVTAAVCSVDNENISFFSPSIGKTRVRDSRTRRLSLRMGPKNFLKTSVVVDLTIQRPIGRFKSKNSSVVEVRLIKGKIDHPTFF